MTEPMVHEPFGEWAALAALGALDGADQVRFETHLAHGCRICEERLRELSETVAALPLALPDVPVPPGLRARVLARAIGEDRFGAPRRARARVLPWVGALAAAGIVGALAWGLLDTRTDLERQRVSIARLQQDLAGQQALTALVSGTDTSVSALHGLPGAERAEGFIVWSPERKRGYLVVHNLPALAPGRQYQLWVGGGPRPAPAGAFDVDSLGHAALVVTVDVPRPDGFTVTVELVGGAAAPSGRVVLAGGAA